MLNSNIRTLLIVVISTAARAQDKPDLAIVNRIRAEAFERSQAMETLFYLTDVNGPRVTNSTGFKSAADWAVKRLESYGLVNVKQEPWGAFGRSWNFTHYEGHMIEPQHSPLIGFPMAWSSGTDGPVRGDAMLAVLATPADFEKYKGQLRGKMVLTMAPKDLEMSMSPLAHRLTDEEVQFNPTQDGGTVFGTSFGSYKAGDPVPPPAVVRGSFRSATPAARITSRMMRWACRDSSSFRTRWSTVRARIIRTWTCTIASRRAT